MVLLVSTEADAGVTVTEATGAGGPGGSASPTGSQTTISQKYSDWLATGAADFQGKWNSLKPSGPIATPVCSRNSPPLIQSRMTPSAAPAADSDWRYTVWTMVSPVCCSGAKLHPWLGRRTPL